MTNKNLGRGLSAFLDIETEKTEMKDVLYIDVNRIKPNPYQPRQIFDQASLESLALSIKKNGVLQPILVIFTENENYQLVAGERRLRASKIAGMAEIPAIVVSMDRREQLEVAILENIQRENLNPIEEAESYKRLLDEFDRTQEELSEILGKSRSHIANILRLLNLPEEVKAMLKRGELTFGHARALIASENPVEIAKNIVKNSLNVRETEDFVKKKRNSESYIDPEILNITKQISELIGLESKIKLKGNGGIIEINFSNFGELDRLISALHR